MESRTPYFDAALLKLAEAAENDGMPPSVFLSFFNEGETRAEVRSFLLEHNMVVRQMQNSSVYMLVWH